MLLVIDTNILLVSVSDRSEFHWLYRIIIEKKIKIAFTNEILTEYEEQIGSHWNHEVAANVTRSLVELSTAKLTIAHFNLKLIVNDEDDNKFVDCAFAANADYIVTNDRDFNILKSINFPSSIQLDFLLLKINDFKKIQVVFSETSARL